MTLMEIKAEIPKLTLEEKLYLSDLLATDEAVLAANARWDEQMREDARAGRLDFLVEETAAEYKRGETKACP